MAVNFDILRPDDLLALQVEGINLKIEVPHPGSPRLVRERPGESAYLVFQFAPQSIAEEASFELSQVQPPTFNPPQANPQVPPQPTPPGTSESPPAVGATGVRMAGPSRLVFRWPDQLDAVDYDIAGLLNWSQFELVLPKAANVLPGAVAASGKSGPAIGEPAALETALELPRRLIISPNLMPGGDLPAWTHASQPVVNAGRAELWHTRLGRVHGTGGAFTEASSLAPVPFRAVWSPDFIAAGALPGHDGDNEPFEAAMSARDRAQIVILSSCFDGYTLTGANGTTKPYVPVPANAQSLFLSALGGWLLSRGAWSYPVTYNAPPGAVELTGTTLDLIEWDHIATQGRDHYVRIVYEGWLYPPGHQASLVKVTERKVLAPGGQSGNQASSPVAYLRQRFYIVPREFDKTYPDAVFASQGREMPLAALLRLNTKVSPDLDPPTYIENTTSSFWITAGGESVQFHMTGRDLAGTDINFIAPLIFVSISETNFDAVQGAYAADNDQRRCVVRGQNVAYADPDAGDTVLKTTALYFTTEFPTPRPALPAPPFVPILDRAEVTIPSLSELIGQQVAVLIELYGPYLQTELDPNAGVFAEIVAVPPGVQFPPAVAFSADQSGGFARPNIALTAISARKGLVSGDPTDAAEGTIDPAAYFGDVQAKLFGTIDLGRLIPVDDITKRADASQNAPEIRTRALPNRKNPTQLVTVVNWQPQLKDYDQPPVAVLFNDGETSVLKLNVQITRNLDGAPPTSTATGRLSNFKLSLFQIIELRIASITYNSANGAKSTVAMDLAAGSPIGFGGPLQFVQALAGVLPGGIFGGLGPSIQATSTALRVTYTLALPSIPCGIFSLQNISFLAGVDLPYLDGKPAVEFGFASRGKPFLLTVEIFGGGGFVHLIVGADGVQMVEGELEFGGNYSLDVGVASGAVHAMAGIYFQLKGTYSDLTGFVDVGGEVSVLGIISISIDLNLSLSWQHSPSGNLIEGRATLTVSVHVLFFSASVQISVERSFSAGSGDPKVDQLMTESDWMHYAEGFGPIGA
jgi:hypothetical protein